MRDIDILNINNTTSMASLSVAGSVVSGIRLMAQRAIIIILTDINGMLRSSEGTEASDIIQAYQNNTNYASLLLTSAISTAMRVLSADSSTDNSDRIKDISIQSINTDNGDLNFTLLVQNASGESYAVSSNNTGVTI